MNNTHSNNTKISKALKDATRLMILNMLSDKDLCISEILENMRISQSKLSHHLKVLSSSGLIISRREGDCMYYGINPQTKLAYKHILDDVITQTKSTICW